MAIVEVEPVKLGDLTLEAYFVRAMLPGQPVAGGFVTITNSGGTDDKLIAASSDAAGRMELHDMVMDGDVMKMREVEGGIVVAAGTTVELKPGGLHLMFMDVPETLAAGDTVAVDLVFEKAGKVELVVPVIAKAAASH
jgi:periplasmic copper chaperone A